MGLVGFERSEVSRAARIFAHRERKSEIELVLFYKSCRKATIASSVGARGSDFRLAEGALFVLEEAVVDLAFIALVASFAVREGACLLPARVYAPSPVPAP